MSVSALTPESVSSARSVSLATGRPLLTVLEEQSGLAPRDFVAMLGASFGLSTLTPLALEEAQPDFSLMPFAEASRRRWL